MRGVFTATVAISGLDASKTLIYITAPANKPVKILGAHIGNSSVETNEQLLATFKRVSSLGTPTGTSLTPTKHELGDQAAASTVVGNVTASEPTYSSNSEFGRQAFASLNGYHFQPTPEEQPIIQGGETVGLVLESTPTTFDAVVTVTFQEIG